MPECEKYMLEQPAKMRHYKDHFIKHQYKNIV